jgi:hypothetical protein
MKYIKLVFLVTVIAVSAIQSKAQWNLSGNSVTSGQFLGTTNNVLLELKRNNATVLSFDVLNNINLGTGNTIPSEYSKSMAIGHNIVLYYQEDIDESIAIGNNIWQQRKGVTIGSGVNSSNKLMADANNGLIVGFNSTIPTFFVSESNGAGTTGKVGIATTVPAEKLDVNGAIHLGTTSTANAGTMRYTGTDFEGYVGGQWKSFTTQSTSQWSMSGSNAYNNAPTVTIGNAASTNAKFNVLGDAFINDKYYYRNQYNVSPGAYVPISLLSGVTTLSPGMAYRIELVTVATGATTGAVYIVRQISASAWEAKPVNMNTTATNSPKLRVNGNVVEITIIMHLHIISMLL